MSESGELESDLPLGPVDEPLIFDDFTYEEVRKTKCFASVCENICGNLLEAAAGNPDTTYLTVCVPCYNENLEELMKTFLSLMENIDFMKRKARLHGDDSGQQLKQDFVNTIPVIVPIFDGTKALSPSIKEWIKANFPGALDGMEGPSEPGLVDVRVACGKWWYFCDDTLTDHEETGNKHKKGMSYSSYHSRNSAYDASRTSISDDNSADVLARLSVKRKGLRRGSHSMRKSLSQNLSSSSKMSQNDSQFSADFDQNDVIYFHVAPIIKRSNHRKHNSHEWFFNSICQGLEERAKVAFLTDCGTTYNATCLARLSYELYFKKDLIGVTARQRVETPNAFFHPCEDSPFSCLEGDHTASGDRRPCWKCYAVYFLSAAPLQGFEFEATLIMNSAMFNLVEALPVMPGPCQLLDWQKMKKFKVVDEYFNLLFKGESDRTVPRLPRRLKSMEGGRIRLSSASSNGSSPSVSPKNSPKGSHFNSPSISPKSTVQNSPSASAKHSLQSISTASSDTDASSGGVPLPPSSSPRGSPRVGSSPRAGSDKHKRMSHGAALAQALNQEKPKEPTSITYTEFLRVNMRLAEDRILSFVCVFSTGYGTKWIPGATFFYQPEIKWQTLLTQRRRWLNGTFASFLFFFNSKRAKSRISGGMFDSHKAGKNIRLVNALWSLQLFQLALVLLSPAVFGSASYIGLKDCAKIWPYAFSWVNYNVIRDINGVDIWLAYYLAVYGIWTLYSYFHAKMPELLCRFLAIQGFIFVFPIYFAVWATIFTTGLDLVNGLVIASLGLPVVIALAQSATSATLYVLYLPWFLFLILFFLVYIPSYSFARLWDTTWGNRAGASDSAISDNIQKFMKKMNFIFIVFLVTLNIGVSWGLIRLLRFGYSIVLGFMFIVFCPMIIQLICSFIFLFVVVPLRNLTDRAPQVEKSITVTIPDIVDVESGNGTVGKSSSRISSVKSNASHNSTNRNSFNNNNNNNIGALISGDITTTTRNSGGGATNPIHGTATSLPPVEAKPIVPSTAGALEPIITNEDEIFAPMGATGALPPAGRGRTGSSGNVKFTDSGRISTSGSYGRNSDHDGGQNSPTYANTLANAASSVSGGKGRSSFKVNFWN